MTDRPIELSVIIAANAPAVELTPCLEAVAQQCRGTGVQIIVAYKGDCAMPEPLSMAEGEVIFLRSPRAASLPQVLAPAITRSRGELIAITDASCLVDRNWVAAILTAHKQPHPVIGGAVEPDGLRSVVDWSAYFFDYGPFMSPLTSRVGRTVPGINIAFKRWALARGKEFVEGEFWKAYWCRCLQADGFPLHLDPSIVVFYRKSFDFWPLLTERFQQGRGFAAKRLAQLSGPTRAIYIIGSPVLPALFCWRLFQEVLPKRRYRVRFFTVLPLIFLQMISWALGEAVGYLFGH